ncbi:fatty acyl-AMP ligase [Actinomadura algeriensis]|uniref:Acyl-CoA synthetase (AMP-forming)/AMP-acid ligase II n=1 Tax=Actinomadura algeriensis TaxID=1679523 RepID=A0ABR9JUQ3_9ACTN|nr:fatty acyl-AMP ligase [Actinomadura algeriensis]MBE1534282.1 acyl-CoA synthetase (AMP-forming)/AMP-acid ligase II [Actinomadura algeriensis]
MEHSAIPLPEILHRRAREQGDRLAFRFLADGTPDQAVDWTYGELARHAAVVAAELSGPRAGGGARADGSRVLLAVDPGLHYVASLFGIFAAGATAVPSFPPAGRRAAERFLSIIADSAPDVVIASAWQAAEAAELADRLPADRRPSRWIFVDDAFFADAATGSAQLPVRCGEPALLQYTSGSTGDPKGIVLTHDNLVSNCMVLHRNMGPDPDRIGLSWLPPYHDMGLMGTIMLALHGGWPLVMMSPVHFVQRPVRWLRAVTEYGVTISVAPNFALDMCVDGVSADELAGLDLGTLRQLYCGAEPVLKATLDRFRDRFAPYGYRESAMIPCYGMAEATLFVSGKPDGTVMRGLRLDKAALERGTVREIPAGAGPAADVVSCGTVAHGHEALIVDPRTRRPVPDGAVGEIWVRGPNVAAGYFGRPVPTAETFSASPVPDDDLLVDADYLRTGDMGFLHGGELFVTGRLKDVIVIAGRNLYPQDIETSALAAHDGLRRAAAFAVRPAAGTGAESLVVVAELRRAGRRDAAELAAIADAVTAAVTAGHGVRPSAVHLGPPGTVPTTTSGKVRRGAARLAFERGTLKRLTPAEPGRTAETVGTVRR